MRGGIFFAMCLSCIPRGSANWRHMSACEEQHAAKLQGSPLNNMRLTGFFEPTAIRINRDTNVHRVHFCASRLRFASLAMVGHGLNNPGNGQRLGKMDLRQHALVRKWQGNSASGRPSETLQSALESTERDDDSSIEESMSMMSGTDVYNKEVCACALFLCFLCCACFLYCVCCVYEWDIQVSWNQLCGHRTKSGCSVRTWTASSQAAARASRITRRRKFRQQSWRSFSFSTEAIWRLPKKSSGVLHDYEHGLL